MAPLVAERTNDGWPKGEFSYTTNDGLVHAVRWWRDDDYEETRLVCGDGMHDSPDYEAQPVSCLMCLTGHSRYDEE